MRSSVNVRFGSRAYPEHSVRGNVKGEGILIKTAETKEQQKITTKEVNMLSEGKLNIKQGE